MAKKKEEKKVVMTRAQKTEATKGLIKELLAVKPLRHNELIEETAKLYIERFKGEDTENVNDVKGRAGSVLDIMQKESEVMYDGGMYALKSRISAPTPIQETEEKPKKTRAKKATTKIEAPAKTETPVEMKTEETPAPKKRGRKPKAEKIEEKKEETSAPVEETSAPVEETPAPKKRGRKPKAKAEEPAKAEEAVKTEETKAEAPIQEKPVIEEKPLSKEEPKKEETSLTVKPKAEVAQKGVMDMSFLIGFKNKPLKEEKMPTKSEPETQEKAEKQAPASKVKAEELKKPQEVKTAQTSIAKPEIKAAQKVEKKALRLTPQKQTAKATPVKRAAQKPLTAEEKLREAFLKRMRTLGGDYFEYYSVYLLERYSMKNGRRLEGMKISGGDHDGGIDGEIELTDKFGFKETIYIQSKNWDPDKGKEESWVVGETLLQQFIGACACRQAKDGKMHCRGIFITTSRFTPEAKRILDDMSDKIVGYDGVDLFEAAKECSFGVIKKNGEWVLDEKLLSGTKAFFNML